jgi:sugar/nucleoside kinase (ribokinase family)
VAVLFAVHPLGSETVAGAVGLGDLFSAAFLLGAFRLHLDLTDLARREWLLAAGVIGLFVGLCP